MSATATVFAYPPAIYPEFKNILFATDFSQCSASALNCLRLIAQRYGSTVRVVHIVPPEGNDAAPLPRYKEHQTIKTRMASFLGEHTFTDIPFEAWVAHGPIAETLFALARCENVDLIALGTRGYRQRLPALGSVANQVLTEAPCPVLTVGDQMRARGEVGRILYATDFSPSSLRALPYALSLSRERGSHLMLLHVDTREVTSDWLEEAGLEKRLLDLVPRDEARLGSVEPIIEIGAVADGIVRAAAENHADVIVLGAPQEILESAVKVYVQADCPILSVG